MKERGGSALRRGVRFSGNMDTNIIEFFVHFSLFYNNTLFMIRYLSYTMTHY